MLHELIMAGFGGQGVMLAGQILASAAMKQGFETCWMPSYGPEMRGGTANCTVIVSDKPIGSPVVPTPSAIVVLNRPSLDKFESMVQPGGLVIVNSSLIHRPVERSDVRAIYVPGNDLAEKELGTAKATNMVMLGAFIGCTGAVDVEHVMAAMAYKLKGKERFLPMNRRALELGMAAAQG